MIGLPEKAIIWDLECTTWPGAFQRGWSGPGEHREIIQMAAAILDTKNLVVLETFEVIVKPERNPILAEYCVDLTGVTQERINGDGIAFPLALRLFYEWAGEHSLYSFGGSGFDLEIIIENCELHGIECPFDPSRFFDTRKVFQAYGIPAEKFSSGTIMTAFDKPNRQNPHDALNDVKNVIDGLMELEEIPM